MKHLIIALMANLLIVGCAGPTGPQGEPGPGSRVVYQSTTPIPTNSVFFVRVPEIKIDDMPAVSVYACYLCISIYSVWIELPFYKEGYSGWGMAYFLEEGKVIFDQCKGYHYKIVVIT